jgi:hypothetical protein
MTNVGRFRLRAGHVVLRVLLFWSVTSLVTNTPVFFSILCKKFGLVSGKCKLRVHF